MDRRLYKLMNWRQMEDVLYSDTDSPYDILGPHSSRFGKFVNGFFPGALNAYIKLEDGEKYEMELEDEAGFYAAFLPKRYQKLYQFIVELEGGKKVSFYDAYQFPLTITEEDIKLFLAGTNYEIYRILGAHPMEINGVKGTRFAVWAPNASRVSVVGDFNDWNGGYNLMQRHKEGGIFELFLPGVKPGMLYKYEIRSRSGQVFLKSDPYANEFELRPGNASMVSDLEKISFSDGKWQKEKNNSQADFYHQPMNIYELHMGSWRRNNDGITSENWEQADRDGLAFINYRQIAKELAAYLKEMGYTHVSLLPIMEHPLDASYGYQITGYYAPSSRFGSPEDFAWFVNYMHKQGLGVILEWNPAYFPKDDFSLHHFDGTSIYEPDDPKASQLPSMNVGLFDYGRNEVSNFLIASALYWVEVFHVDGLSFSDLSILLYLDYGKEDGQWTPNMYGGNENLAGVEFLKHLNSIMKLRGNGAILIAKENGAYPRMTGPVEEENLGFDYKVNNGFTETFLDYMGTDTYYRHNKYDDLTFPMVYAYSEKFLLSFPHDLYTPGKGSLISKMSGESLDKKFANLRLFFAYQMMHPGKKLNFMGQEFADTKEWSENGEPDWTLLNGEKNIRNQETFRLVKDLNHLYLENPALYERDFVVDGFMWLNNLKAKESILSFMRFGRKFENSLLVVANFDTMDYEDLAIGVPLPGKYKEILNTDDVRYGGEGRVNQRLKVSKMEEADGRENSIRIKLPALSLTVFRYTPVDEESKKKKAPKRQRVSSKPSKVAEQIMKEMEESNQ